MIRRPLMDTEEDQVTQPGTDDISFPPSSTTYDETEGDNEHTSLLSKSRSKSTQNYGSAGDAENQRPAVKRSPNLITKGVSSVAHYTRTLSNPKSWDRRVIWKEAVVYPASLVPAVLLGLLLNILDALSYGMILFPLGETPVRSPRN
ncbi:sulfate transporter [Penicillium expansum]|nr:sulfate transporter [Penicillium expansum]